MTARRSTTPRVRLAVDAATHRGSIDELRRAAGGCRACDLWEHATQSVFGEGPADARMMLVGEQPGDREDVEGRPFVGPAGALLARALGEAGIERAEVYLTNAVKHFKWLPRGKRRLHAKPTQVEVGACHPWLEAEIAAIRPVVIVCLGATAAQALLGPAFRVSRQRGQPVRSSWAPHVLATLHPSAVLRAPDAPARERVFQDLVTDLKAAAALRVPTRSAARSGE